ncbi:NAF1, H/ACA ribonucleoprotein complex non-core subunit NAF1 [Babesia caballi]|uniref:H/ACA ribonucleoprotein complex subunit n=1 Tax=Babesia caballi TaxID=5871 RepID=A0AAV4LSK9_BABCB|nr:NAF1, H/ACA ribonucleoprotein complex non-core subunit NAF1 [Babesia caballi]
MESINGIAIDGKTEIDDLALVMHIAHNENERIRELESLGQPSFRGFLRCAVCSSKYHETIREHDASSGSDSDDSAGDLETVYHDLRSSGFGSVPDNDREKDYQPAVDPDFPIDNIRIVDTVDLPPTVAESFPIAPIGQCMSIVGRVVVVQCTEPSRVLDLGSIVCLRDRRIVGTVSDTFGNTSSPFHMVVCNDPTMVKPGDAVFYDVKHSTLVSDLNVAETASSISSGGESDEDCNPKRPDAARQPVKLKQYYNDLESH